VVEPPTPLKNHGVQVSWDDYYDSQYLRSLLMGVLHEKTLEKHGKTPAGWRKLWGCSPYGSDDLGFHPRIFNCDPDLGVKSLTHSENHHGWRLEIRPCPSMSIQKSVWKLPLYIG